ncbi:MAG: carbohydrate ABC transporter permease [Acidimicrobiia bacterium]
MSADASAVAVPSAAEVTVPAPPRRRHGRRALRYAAIVGLALIIVFPLYLTVVSSLLPFQDFGARPPKFFPTDPQWSAYSTAWQRGSMSTYMRNSFIVTAGMVTLEVLTAILAGYAFSFLRFPMRGFVFVVFLATLMIPFEVTIATNRDTVTSLGWYSTFPGLIIPFAAGGFGAFMLRQAFLQLPRELADAAALDGYGHWRFLWRVAVPLVRPSIAALATFSFLGAWQQFTWPFLITKPARRTVQIGVAQLANTTPKDLNVVFAGLVIAIVPLVIMLLFFQKQLVRGLTAGAVKG